DPNYVNSFTMLSNLVYFHRIKRFSMFQQLPRHLRNRDLLARVGVERHAHRSSFGEPHAGGEIHDFVRERHARAPDCREAQTHFELVVRERRCAIVALRMNDDRADTGRSGRAAEMTPPRQAALLEVREVRSVIRVTHRIAIAEPHDELMT